MRGILPYQSDPHLLDNYEFEQPSGHTSLRRYFHFEWLIASETPHFLTTVLNPLQERKPHLGRPVYAQHTLLVQTASGNIVFFPSLSYKAFGYLNLLSSISKWQTFAAHNPHYSSESSKQPFGETWKTASKRRQISTSQIRPAHQPKSPSSRHKYAFWNPSWRPKSSKPFKSVSSWPSTSRKSARKKNGWASLWVLTTLVTSSLLVLELVKVRAPWMYR